jgi:ribosomal protein S12 methylthiotransferase accessory factor
MEFDEEKHLVSKVAIEVTLPQDFPEKYRAGVIGAANLCTVKKHLQQPPAIELSARTVSSSL